MTGKKEKVLAALISIRAPTRAIAAKEAGVSASTLRRWMREDEDFRAAYKEALTELLEDASAQAKQNLTRALDVLAEIMESGENSQVRISAARSTLEYSLKLTEAVDIVARMDALEKMLSEVERQ